MARLHTPVALLLLAALESSAASLHASSDASGLVRRAQGQRGASGGGRQAAAATTAAAVRRALRQAVDSQQLHAVQPLFNGRVLQDDGYSGAGGDGAVPDPAAKRCPQLSKEVLEARARRTESGRIVMYAVANEQQWEFARNWLFFAKKAGIGYYVVAAADAFASRQLAEQGEPCFEWIDEEIPTLGLEWGQEGWRRMTWSKVFILDRIVDWGLNLVVSDMDVVWFRDPSPLLDQYPAADLIFSTDATNTANEDGDEGLALDGSAGQDFNTGVYLLRYGNDTAAWAHAWRAYFDKCPDHDQMCAYDVVRTGSGNFKPHPQEPRLQCAYDCRLWTGILPPSLAMSAHTYFLQSLHKAKRVRPYAVHLTWTYNGAAGKRARMRDMALWVDPPDYYELGGFVTVDLTLPAGDELPLGFNRWNENEDMVSFHLDWIHRQLQQAYVGMALAVASGRAFILPKFQCWCEKIWYGVVRCRVVSSPDMPLPVTCPQDYLFQPGNYADSPDQWGPPLDLREPSFLDNKRTPAEVKESVLIIQPSATLDCADCEREEPAGPDGSLRVLVPPSLHDTQLLRLLEPYRRHRVWRLSFEGVGATARAFAGFSDREAAAAFDRRMAHITTDFCCRREEEAPRYHKEQQMRLFLNMTSQFSFSSSSSGSSGGGGGGGRGSGDSVEDVNKLVANLSNSEGVNELITNLSNSAEHQVERYDLSGCECFIPMLQNHGANPEAALAAVEVIFMRILLNSMLNVLWLSHARDGLPPNSDIDRKLGLVMDTMERIERARWGLSVYPVPGPTENMAANNVATVCAAALAVRQQYNIQLRGDSRQKLLAGGQAGLGTARHVCRLAKAAVKKEKATRDGTQLHHYTLAQAAHGTFPAGADIDQELNRLTSLMSTIQRLINDAKANGAGGASASDPNVAAQAAPVAVPPPAAQAAPVAVPHPVALLAAPATPAGMASAPATPPSMMEITLPRGVVLSYRFA
ncbi:hypothetical protein ABPG75_004631 [Micractinium tetrahymenae]